MAASSPARADAFQISYEAPGVQHANPTALCVNAGGGTCTVGTESFETRTSGAAFTTDFGTGSVINGQYSSVQIIPADQYGGAGGTGKYPVAFGVTPYSVTLSTSLTTGINYFGYWLSALDGGNQVSFFKNGVDVYDFTPAKLIGDLGSCLVATPSAYCKNPTTPFLGQNNQQYVFVNFFDPAGTFDKVSFSENPASGGYESDNHSVGFVTAVSGTNVNVPEPASLALLGGALAGFAVLFRKRG